jgi:small-conductance mechanosensitive channel
MRRMRWFKLAAIAGGILIAFFIVGGVVHLIFSLVTDLVIAAIVAAAVYVAIKVARSGKQISRKRAEREVREREPEPEEYRRPLPRADVEPAARRPSTQDVDDDLAKLKRELGL